MWRRRSLTSDCSNSRKLTRRTRSGSVEQVIGELSSDLSGWINYFAFCENSRTLDRLDSWIRRRLRCLIWKQWKYGTEALRGTGEARRRGRSRCTNKRAALTVRGTSAAEPPCTDPYARWCVGNHLPMSIFGGCGVSKLRSQTPRPRNRSATIPQPFRNIVTEYHFPTAPRPPFLVFAGVIEYGHPVTDSIQISVRHATELNRTGSGDRPFSRQVPLGSSEPPGHRPARSFQVLAKNRKEPI